MGYTEGPISRSPRSSWIHGYYTLAFSACSPERWQHQQHHCWLAHFPVRHAGYSIVSDLCDPFYKRAQFI